MRKLCLLLLLSLTGCTGSLNPLYESNKDLLDPKDYLGVWLSDQGRRIVRTAPYEGQDTKEDRLVFVQILEDPRFGQIDRQAPVPADTGDEFIGGFVKLGDEVYLDMTVSPSRLRSVAPELTITGIIHMLQIHTFTKVTRKDDTLHVRGLDLHQLEAMLAKNPKLIAHKKLQQRQDGALIQLVARWREPAKDLTPLKDPYVGPSLLLTAETVELRQFVADHGKANIWADGAYFTRGKDGDFEPRWQKLQARIKDAQDRRKKDEIPQQRLDLR